MNFSERFIQRPIATSLLMLGLAGVRRLGLRPAARRTLPDVDFPPQRSRPTFPAPASPDTMATSVATPLEQQFAAIPGLVAMTSWSGLGYTRSRCSSRSSRNIDGAATDVQTAINAAGGLLPKDLPNPPTYKQGQRGRPADPDLLVHSDDLPIYKVDDFAFSVLAQTISAIPGVAQVNVAGQQDFAVRIRARSRRAGLARDRHGGHPQGDRGRHHQPGQRHARGTLPVLRARRERSALPGGGLSRRVIVAFRNGAPVRIRDIAEVVDGARLLPRTGAWAQQQEGAEVLLVYRQPGGNTTEIVDSVRATMAELVAEAPTAIKVDLVSDRSTAIEAAIG